MHLFLTSVLPFLAHDHPSAVAFLTCRYHNFHASIIPEFLSDEDRVKSFCEARQQNELRGDEDKQFKNLYNLFVQTPLMQFSPSLFLHQKDSAESILKPLLATKYFTRTLQRCTIRLERSQPISNGVFQALSKVRSLTRLDLDWSDVENQHLEIIIKSFPSLETLTMEHAAWLDPTKDINILSSPPPPPCATKTLRSLIMKEVPPLFARHFVLHFTNLRKLVLSAKNSSRELDLLALTSSLPLLADLSLGSYILDNIESLKNLVHLSSLHFSWCHIPNLNFLTEDNSLPRLTTLTIHCCYELQTSSFASLVHASQLQDLNITHNHMFNNECLKYLQNMIHLRSLDLSNTGIVGDRGSLKTLMQNLFQLEELDLSCCRIGNQAALAGALYSTHSRLRVLNLSSCNLVDDELNGIGALKNTLEVLDLSYNVHLTQQSLVQCNDLVKLKSLKLEGCGGIDDLSPLKDCLNLEDLDVLRCEGLADDSFKVFSEEPNSFPNLRVLALKDCKKLTEKVFEHLSKNSNLVYQLKELNVRGMSEMVESSPTARNNLCRLQGLRQLRVSRLGAPDVSKNVKLELLRELKNLQGF